jgi:murein L,D-transpeptidase YafK
MRWLLIIYMFVSHSAWSEDTPDRWDIHRAVFSTASEDGEIAVQSDIADEEFSSQVSPPPSAEADVNCSSIPDSLTEPVRNLIADMETIVTDELMEKVDAPQALVNKALATSKKLVCAEVELFVKAHDLDVAVNCAVNPQIVPPFHLQVVKFPGMVAKKESLEAEIAELRTQAAANPSQTFYASKIAKLEKNLQCLMSANTSNFSCRYYLESEFQRGKAVVQVELQDRSGQWFEFKQSPIDYFSGVPGPKTAKGDMQVPEARFKLSSVNPASSYFTAVHVDYENWSNRAALLGDLNVPVPNKGGDIKIHGHGGSVGCLDMGNRAAPWMAALVDLSLKQGRVPEIDIYPTNMSHAAEVASWPGYQQYEKFWGRLSEKYWDKHGAKVRRDLPRVEQILRATSPE